jgi:hypothetical protein
MARTSARDRETGGDLILQSSSRRLRHAVGHSLHQAIEVDGLIDETSIWSRVRAFNVGIVLRRLASIKHAIVPPIRERQDPPLTGEAARVDIVDKNLDLLQFGLELLT